MKRSCDDIYIGIKTYSLRKACFFFKLVLCFILMTFSNYAICENNIKKLKTKKHVCGTDLVKTPRRIYVKQEEPSYRILNEKNYEPIRIHFDFSYIENNLDVINKKDLIDLKQKIIPKAKEVFEKILKVKRLSNKLKLNSPHCETFPIPEIYNASGEGIEADLVIFVLIDSSGFFKENLIEAAAIHCLQDQETRRPIAGYIQFKQDLGIDSTVKLDYFTWLSVHEITHILVINKSLYEDYIDPNTNIPLGYDRVIGSKVLQNGKKMNYMKTTKILEKAKKHFGCNDLYGLPLEYAGGAGTAGSHWAKRYMNTDYMIGESYGENFISEISLALFEDSGWYEVDYKLANILNWGKNKGCEFFDGSQQCIFRDKTKKLPESNITSRIKNDINILDRRNKEVDDKYGENEIIYHNESIDLHHHLNNFNETLSININLVKINSNNKTAMMDQHQENITNLIRTIKPNKNPLELQLDNSKEKVILKYKTNFVDEFCVDFNKPVCSPSHIFRGKCIVEETNFLENHEIHFRNRLLAGNDLMINRCPVVSEEVYKQTYYGGSCRYGERFNSTKRFEKICPECACFMSNLVEINPPQHVNSGKFIYRKNNNFNEKQEINENMDDILPNNREGEKNMRNNRMKIGKLEKVTIFNKRSVNEIHYSFKEKLGRIKDKENEYYEYEVIRMQPNLTDQDFMASCFEFKCQGYDLYVLIDNKKYKCDDSGMINNIPGYVGNIKCPDKKLLCNEKYLCKFGCVNKFSNKSPIEFFSD